MINVVDFLKQEGFRYYEAGTKNTSDGWVSIECPFCDDTSNHLGINVQEGNYSCWKCSARGSFFKLVMKLKRISYEEARSLLGYYHSTSTKSVITKPERRDAFEIEKEWIIIEDGSEHPALNSFIKRRAFSIETLVKEKCWVTSYGKFKHRLILPVFYGGKIVAAQARDITGEAAIPYLNTPNLFEFIYWIDNWAGGKLVITEGIFDSWRVGKGRSVALFSVNFTTTQIRQLVRLNPSQVLIAFDQDARRKAVDLKSQLEPYFPVRILDIKGDPADMETTELRKLIGGANALCQTNDTVTRGSPSTYENSIKRSKESCDDFDIRVR